MKGLFYHVRTLQTTDAKTKEKLTIHYAQKCRAHGTIDIYELSEDISNGSTVTTADVLAVLEALSGSVLKYIELGFNVQLARLGSLSASIRSKSALSEQEFTRANILGARLNFAPSTKMKQRLRSMPITMIESKDKPEIEGRPEMTEKND